MPYVGVQPDTAYDELWSVIFTLEPEVIINRQVWIV